MSENKILIVENNRPERELYTEVFESHGFCVDQAISGEEALKKLSQDQYRIVLLDIALGKVSGLTVLEKLRASPETKDLPVIITSNLDESAFLKQGRKLGISGYMIKADHTPGEIVTKVKGILSGKDK